MQTETAKPTLMERIHAARTKIAVAAVPVMTVGLASAGTLADNVTPIIDDVVDLSFAAALGFTFGENIFHFLTAFSRGGNPVALLKFLLEREFFILPIHLVCSGFFGYFYGMGLFAGEEIRAKNAKSLLFRLLKKLLFFIPESRLFLSAKILQGTIVSVSVYAAFFVVVEREPTIGDFFALFGVERWVIDEKLLPLVAFLFFQIGTVVLFSLLDKKRRWHQQNLLLER